MSLKGSPTVTGKPYGHEHFTDGLMGHVSHPLLILSLSTQAHLFSDSVFQHSCQTAFIKVQGLSANEQSLT